MTISRRRVRALLIALAGLVLVSATQAGASTIVRFLDSPFAAGFDPAGFPVPEDHYRLDEDVVFGTAGQIIPGDPSADFDIDYQIEPCLLLNFTGDCLTEIDAGAGPYTYIATLTVLDIAGPIPDQGVFLFLSGLGDTPAYDPASIDLVLDPVPRLGFSFSPLSTILWEVQGTTYYYLGFLLTEDDIGESFTIEFAVNTPQLTGGTPEFLTNAAYDFTFVPEPGTGLLLGLGLAGLAKYRRR